MNEQKLLESIYKYKSNKIIYARTLYIDFKNYPEEEFGTFLMSFWGDPRFNIIVSSRPGQEKPKPIKAKYSDGTRAYIYAIELR